MSPLLTHYRFSRNSLKFHEIFNFTYSTPINTRAHIADCNNSLPVPISHQLLIFFAPAPSIKAERIINYFKNKKPSIYDIPLQLHWVGPTQPNPAKLQFHIFITFTGHIFVFFRYNMPFSPICLHDSAKVNLHKRISRADFLFLLFHRISTIKQRG